MYKYTYFCYFKQIGFGDADGSFCARFVGQATNKGGEHNMDVIKVADYVLDMGPEGGNGGGEVVAVGTPEDIIKIKASHTGKFLKEELKYC